MLDFRGANPEELCHLYNGCAPPRFRIDPDLFVSHTIGSPLFDWGASLIMPQQGFIAVKKSASTLYRGPDPDAYHISLVAFQDPTILLDLLHETKARLAQRGATRLLFGMDSAHFFPGCPVDWPSLKDFLLIAGFESGGESHDLERDLAGYVEPRPVPAGYQFRPVRADDLASVEAFLDREFPGRWRYDVMDKIERENDPGVVYGLFVDGLCEGFALTQMANSVYPIGGAVWKMDLGENWCSLGPIGVSQSVRKQGCGFALLGRALAHMRDRGGRRCIIDWTGLVEFYGHHGFEVTRTYRYCSLNLELPGEQQPR